MAAIQLHTHLPLASKASFVNSFKGQSVSSRSRNEQRPGKLSPAYVPCRASSDYQQIASAVRLLSQSTGPRPQQLWDLSKATTATTSATIVAPPTPSRSIDLTANPAMLWGIAAAFGIALVAAVAKSFSKGSRKYKEGENTVGEEYNAWTDEGILEYYWGEHIHLGYYTDEERAAGYLKKNFKQAKFDFTDRMFEWAGCKDPKTILDVGCGIGGSSRHLAKKLPGAKVTGITLSTSQQKRAIELAKEQGVNNAEFKIMNALAMDFPDNSFDLVWACESGEHMPDKAAYIKEMTRVLKPGGTLVVATWCQKEAASFTDQEKKMLQFLYDEWAHPHFISIEEYVRIMDKTGAYATIGSDNWAKQTINSWRHSIWVGVFDPWIVVFSSPRVWWKTIREIVTIERMHQAFASGLMTYGMMKGVKK
eukprot:jgi/Mesvir1/16924/Mv15785-RA.1